MRGTLITGSGVRQLNSEGRVIEGLIPDLFRIHRDQEQEQETGLALSRQHAASPLTKRGRDSQ